MQLKCDVAFCQILKGCTGLYALVLEFCRGQLSAPTMPLLPQGDQRILQSE